jgi:hypothetical protein
VAPIYSSLLTITLYSSVRTTLTYNDTKYSAPVHDVIAEFNCVGEKSVPLPLCPPQMPHGLVLYLTGAYAVRGQQLIA